MNSYNILPADRYKVINKTILSDIDKKNLSDLYGPIIGPLAVSLYLCFINDLNDAKECSEYLLHHHLLATLKCTNKTLVEARQSLEAIGLLRSYVKEDNVNIYIYELYSPLSIQEFFNNPILSAALYSNLGPEEYEKLIKKVQKKKYNLSEFKEITKDLDEVYKSDSFKEITDLKTKTTRSMKLTSKIDYEFILESIPSLNEKALNKKTKEMIDNISFIYNVDTLRMIEFIRKSLNEFEMIDKNTLRKTARDFYQLSNNSMPTIVYRTQPEFLKKASGDSSLRSKIISMFENISPYEFLKHKNKGAEPTSKDLKLVESLLFDLELTPAVVNVLIDYCLKKNNKKITTR